jgi:glycosyltransferase involved in cell wall biosynthesis
MPPFFSIVIPAYNRSGLLISAVRSVLKQSFSNFECVIVNDGSTDDMVDVINREFGDELQCRIITQQNSERGAARNNGFRNSRGEYVVFLDSDDLLLPNHLATLHTKIIEQKYPLFIATKFNFIRDNKIYNGTLADYSEGYYDYTFFLNGNALACNVCVKRNNPSLHLFVEDRNYSIMEDWMFFVQNLRYDKMYLIDKVTLLMNDHADRSMRGDGKVIIEKNWLAIKWMESNCDLSVEDKKMVEAHGNYFSAIHSYIDGERKDCFSFLQKATKINGWRKKYMILWFKNLIGRKTIRRLADVMMC